MTAPTLAKSNDWWSREFGYQEYGTNGNKYAACAGHLNHQPWCATSQVCCSKSIGQTRPPGTSTAGTVANAQGFRRAGKLTTKPTLGAEAFVADRYGNIIHVGRVRSIERTNGVTYVILDEGNHNNRVGRSRRRGIRLPGTPGIVAYGLLPYAKPVAKPVVKAPVKRPVKFNVPGPLRLGDSGLAVLNLRAHLGMKTTPGYKHRAKFTLAMVPKVYADRRKHGLPGKPRVLDAAYAHKLGWTFKGK